MFLQRKKGDIVVQFVVLLIVAIIMIIVVTSFGQRIWSTFFPSTDKSTAKSFQAFYYVVNEKSVSDLDYDMTALSVYLKKKYCMVLFDTPTISFKQSVTTSGYMYSNTQIISENYYAPTECNNKQCICLYNDLPEVSDKKKEKNLVQCLSFSNNININHSRYDMNKGICSGDGERYVSFLIIKRTEGNTPYIYILDDNETNRALDKLWNVPVCTDDAGSLCFGKTDESVVTFNDAAGIKRIYDYCIQGATKYFSTSIKCEYVAEKRTCRPDCSYGDVSPDCGVKYKKCEDYNQIDGITKYISMDKDYMYYYMCNNDADFCKLGCKSNPGEIYVSNDPNSPDGSVSYLSLDDTIKQGCNLKYLTNIQGRDGKFLTSYDISKQICVDGINKYYNPQKNAILACKSDNAACENFINTKTVDCSIKYLSDTSNNYWITYYNPICDADVRALFGAVSFCVKA